MHDFIKDLLRKNFTAKTIIARCLKLGWNPSIEEIENIRSELKVELEMNRKSKSKNDKEKIVALFTEQETYFDFAKRMGVNTEYENSVDLISSVQKITADIFIRQSLVLLRALELQSEGVGIDTAMFIKGYEVALKGICIAWGIQNLIDVNAAFQCLESKGYLSKNHALSQISEISNN